MYLGLGFLFKYIEALTAKKVSPMQQYIESKRPQSGADIERLESEYQRTLGRGKWGF